MVIGSFGPAPVGYNSEAFSLAVDRGDGLDVVGDNKPLRYGKLPEIHHIFRADPKSPPLIISVAFVFAVLSSVPPLLVAVSLLLSLSRTILTATVALPRRQPQPPPQSPLRRPRLACPLRRLHRRHRGRLLPVLHQLEPVQDPPSACRFGACRLLVRQQSPHRGPGAALGRLTVNERERVLEGEGDPRRRAKHKTTGARRDHDVL